MPNPLQAADDFLAADVAADNLPAGTTHSVEIPAVLAVGKVHVQYAWDGTPSDASNREDAAVRFTVWTAKGQPTQAADVAAGIRARLLRWSNADVWRVDRGAGRLPGIDPDSKLPFCTFTVNAVMHATAAD